MILSISHIGNLLLFHGVYLDGSASHLYVPMILNIGRIENLCLFHGLFSDASAKSLFSPNELEHWSHWKSLTPSWVAFRCFFNSQLCPNDFEHLSHWKSLDPLWTFWSTWWGTWSLRMNPLHRWSFLGPILGRNLLAFPLLREIFDYRNMTLSHAKIFDLKIVLD